MNALLGYGCRLSSCNGDPLRPGIVHRLDKDTTGLLVVAKTDAAHENLARQIREKQAHRIYTALCFGNVRVEEGVIDAPLGRSPRDRKKMAVLPGGRPAVTEYRVLARYGAYTLVEARLQTGRTHQIRVHFASRGFPVVGDPLYTRAKGAVPNGRADAACRAVGAGSPCDRRMDDLYRSAPARILRTSSASWKPGGGKRVERFPPRRGKAAKQIYARRHKASRANAKSRKIEKSSKSKNLPCGRFFHIVSQNGRLSAPTAFAGRENRGPGHALRRMRLSPYGVVAQDVA